MPKTDTRSDVTLPVDAEFSSGRELLKGLTFFVAMVGGVSACNGTLLLVTGKSQGRAVLLFSGAVWLLWIGMRFLGKSRERARTAQSSGHLRISSSAIEIPARSGEVGIVRWMDLKEVRLTRDSGGTAYYEFWSGDDAPAIVLERARVKDPQMLDAELAARGPNFQQTFEWDRPGSPLPSIDGPKEAPSGERFELSLPARGQDTLRSCAGTILALAVILGFALAFPDLAVRFLKSRPGTMFVIAVVVLAAFVATRSRKSCIVAGMEGLHVRAPGFSIPPFIRWDQLLDYTFVSTGGRNPSRIVTVWTPEGSWKLDRVRIKDESGLRAILGKRSARKGLAWAERSVRGEN